jgi:hypothetical protein
MLIGPWRVLDRVDSGSFGIVFKVELARDPSAGPFAMKMAARPGDARFEREARMLSLGRSPYLPRFHDFGTWESGGQQFPYIVMQWVEGVPLYPWASAPGRYVTSRQVLRLLAQVARALEVVHEHGLHRNVKGDNVLVGPEGQVVLLDVGACWLPDGRALTEGALAPGTPSYRSPEALAFREQFYRKPGAPYQARPQDDVYGLGVMAYRLVTTRYPPEPGGSGRFLKPSDLATVAPALEALILRMLSPRWQERGTASELAQALEKAAAGTGGGLDKPVLPSRSVRPTEPTQFRGEEAWRLRRLARRVGLSVVGVTVAALLLLVAAPLLQHLQVEEETPGIPLPPVAEAWQAPSVETPDGGVGESALASAHDTPHVGMPAYAIGLPMPKTPLPRQRRPPCERGETAINGACWVAVRDERPPCGSKMYDHEDGCYFASYNAPRQPASGEP